MKLLVFSVYDKAVQAFLPPMFMRSQGEALRAFTEACNNNDHQFKRHAADYTLFKLGEWDDASAMFASADPVRIISALECIVDDDVFPPAKKIS